MLDYVYKEKFFRFLRHVDSVDELIIHFRDMNHDRIKEFYINGRENSDIIISASPEFLLRFSGISAATGRFRGKNQTGAVS